MDAIAWACSTYQTENGYICKYLANFEVLKRFFGDLIVPTLIDMFTHNTHCAVYDWYKELKQQGLTWEQFLTEVTVINDEKAQLYFLKQKEAQVVKLLSHLR